MPMCRRKLACCWRQMPALRWRQMRVRTSPQMPAADSDTNPGGNEITMRKRGSVKTQSATGVCPHRARRRAKGRRCLRDENTPVIGRAQRMRIACRVQSQHKATLVSIQHGRPCTWPKPPPPKGDAGVVPNGDDAACDWPKPPPPKPKLMATIPGRPSKEGERRFY